MGKIKYKHMVNSEQDNLAKNNRCEDCNVAKSCKRFGYPCENCQKKENEVGGKNE